MTIYGLFNDGASVVTAQILRQIVALLSDAGTSGPLDVAGGVRMTRGAPTALKVTAGVSGLTVTIQPGMAVVPGTSTVGQGAYILTSTAVETRTLATADGAQARYDRIVAKVTDTGDASSLYEIVPVTGTPAGSPALPALPANSLPLGYVLVPAGASTPGALTVTDDRLAFNTTKATLQSFGMDAFNLTGAPSTNSGTFFTLIRGETYKRFPTLRIDAIHNTDASTSAEIRATIGGTQIALTTTSAGIGQFTLAGAIPASVNIGQAMEVDVQARVLSGPGNVAVRVLSAAQTN